MNYIEPFTNKVNAFFSVVAAILSYVFGTYWIFFVGFFVLNIFDWISGVAAARITKTENSHKGWVGVWKKVAYWMIIALAFGLGFMFIQIGNSLGVNLGFMTIFGLFTLICLILNEIRSIIENLYKIPDFHIPYVFVKGLEIANNTVNTAINATLPKDDQNEEESVE